MKKKVQVGCLGLLGLLVLLYLVGSNIDSSVSSENSSNNVKQNSRSKEKDHPPDSLIKESALLVKEKLEVALVGTEGFGRIRYREMIDMPGEWYGSQEIQFGNNQNLVNSTLRYALSGKSSNELDEAMLRSFIMAPSNLKEGKSKMKNAAIKLYSSLGLNIPEQISRSISDHKSTSITLGGLSSQYEVERCDGNSIRQADGSQYKCWTMTLKLTALPSGK